MGPAGPAGPGADKGTLISNATTSETDLYNDGNLRITGICVNNEPRLTFYNLQNNGVFSATWTPQETTGTPGDPDDAVQSTVGREDRDFDSVPADESKSFGTADPPTGGTVWATTGAHGTFIYQQGTTVVSGFFQVKEDASAGGVVQNCVIAVLVIDP